MSQVIWNSINPTTTSGTMLAAILTDFKDALVSGNSGTTRPANLQAGGVWLDVTNQAAPNFYWAFKLYDGTTDREVFRLSTTVGFGGSLTADGTFEVRHVAADTAAAIIEGIKQRIVDNGQINSGDTVWEMRFVGGTNTSTTPTVAYLRYTATDDQTSSEYGGTLSMYSTPDATSAIAEHIRMIGGQFESVLAQKLNSLRPVSQNVATTATIAQLNADYLIVEMTGSTATAIQGINSAGKSKYVVIHNRSSAAVTLKHQNNSASAVDRIKLPASLDHIIQAEGTATLFYCTTDSRWKLRSASVRKASRVTQTIFGAWNQWTCPASVTNINITGFQVPMAGLGQSRMIDAYGFMYAWGSNSNGVLGVGDVTSRSTPVAVLGGLQFMPTLNVGGASGMCLFLSKSGAAYGWGSNTNGQLGLGDVTPRSSPVAVLGGLKFAHVYRASDGNFALAENGALYSMGDNTSGKLGLGDVTPRSSPVAVLGGLKFLTIAVSGFGGGFPVYGITKDGDAYAWGGNTNGELGVGDVAMRSSPVAVLGGLKFRKIMSGSGGFTGFGTMGLTSDGLLYAWGKNEHGSLGVGDVTPRSSPVAVLGGLTFKDFTYSASPFTMSSFGLTEDGTLYAWGLNTWGQLGLGDVVPRSSPVAVLGGLKFKNVYTVGGSLVPARTSTYGVTLDGTLYAWGHNEFGQLGLGDVTPRSSPVAVLGGGNWGAVLNMSSGEFFGVRTDGTLYAMGSNFGELGLGDYNVPRSSPVAVLGGFGLAGNLPVVQLNMEVTPSTVYTVRLGDGVSTFGNKHLGLGLERINIEYHL